jgi:predicted nucleotidyltransferase
MPDEGPSFDEMLATLKKVAGILREADVPFLLGGSLACWARGGPESDHDLDLMLRKDDAERALLVLEQHGFRPEKPPEGWLYKAYDDGVLVDLIFEPTGQSIRDEVFERAEELNVNAVPMQVMSLEDVLVTKIEALREHELNYDSLVEMARPLREQIDWDDVRTRTDHSPYAKAFFTLVEELEIAPKARS